MISKQETFKHLLAGYGKSINLDKELWLEMINLEWLTQPLVPNVLVKLRPNILDGYFAENSSEWHKDISIALERLGRI